MDWTLLFIGSLVLLAIVSLLGFTGCSSLAEADPWPPDKKDPEPEPDPEVVYDDLVTLGEDGSASLVGYWPLGEASGTVAEDRSNNDNHGTYVQGDGSLLQGQPGIVDSTTSTYFAGGSYVEVPDNPTMALGAFSAEAWVRFDGTMQEQEWYTVLDSSSQVAGADLRGYVIYAKHDTLTQVTQWAVLVGNQGSGGSGVVVIGSEAELNQPTHVGCSYDGQTISLYVNGTLINVGGVVTYLEPTGRPLSIGAGLHQAGFYPFKGYIQKVAVYDTALPPEHFAGHYAQLQTP
jgi:Concanavalin A-like lectin/glucanases superfamily